MTQMFNRHFWLGSSFNDILLVLSWIQCKKCVLTKHNKKYKRDDLKKLAFSHTSCKSVLLILLALSIASEASLSNNPKTRGSLAVCRRSNDAQLPLGVSEIQLELLEALP